MSQDDSSIPERIGPYKVLRVMGAGSFAQVSVGEHVETGEKVALKVVNTALWNDKNKARRTTLLKREIRLCRLLHHPNVIRMIGTMQDGPKVILVMEHGAGGDLENFIYAQKHRYLSEPKTRDFFRQIISGVDYLHKNYITHRDIKPANIILDSKQTTPKLIDFGFTNIFDEKEKLASFLGSPHFAAPELLTGTKYEGPQVDIWSLGVTLYACLTGRLPFQASTMEKLMDLIVRADFTFPPHVSDEAQDLIRKMLTADTTYRATMEDVRQHPWMNIGYPTAPPDLAIPRDAAVIDVDETVLAALGPYGFEDKEVNRQAITSPGTSVVKVVYCLLLEARQREKQRQMIEQAKHAPPSAAAPAPAGQTGASAAEGGEGKDHLTLAAAMKNLLSPMMGRKGRKRAVSEPGNPEGYIAPSTHHSVGQGAQQPRPPPPAQQDGAVRSGNGDQTDQPADGEISVPVPAAARTHHQV